MKKLFFLLTLIAFVGTAIAQNVPTISMVKNVGVNGESTGVVTLEPNGTTINSVTGGGAYASNKITGLAANDYTFVITYNTTETITLTQTITQPEDRTLAVIIDEPTVLTATLAQTGDGVYCVGETVELTVTPTGGTASYDFAWSNTIGTAPTEGTGATSYSIQTTNAMVGAHEITVEVTDANGCTVTTASVNVAVNPIPTVAIAATSNELCTGGSIVLTATGAGSSSLTPAYTYAWDGGALASATGAIQTVNAAGTYSVVVTDANGCTHATTSKAETTITTGTGTAPDVQVLAEQINTCGQSDVTLAATSETAGVSYLWAPTTNMTPNTGAESVVSVTAPVVETIYSVTVNDGTCTNAATVTVTPSTDAAIAVVANASSTSICSNATVTLNAETEANVTNYVWSSDNAGHGLENFDLATVTAAPTATPITYNVSIIDANGCTATDDVEVAVTPGTAAALLVNADELTNCNGASVTLAAYMEGVTAYTWTPSITETTAQVSVTPTVATTYTVSATDANGCTNTNTITVTPATTTPAPTVTTSDLQVCSEVDKNFVAPTGTTSNITWFPVLHITNENTTTPTVNIENAGTDATADTYNYTVTVEDANGCNATDVAVVTVNTTPSVTIAAHNNATEICQDGSTVITATGANSSFSPVDYTYDWTSIGTTDDNAAQTVAAGTYAVKVTDGNACVSAEASIIITESTNAAPNLAVTNSIVNSCGDGSVVLAATSSTDNVTFAWTPSTGIATGEANQAIVTADVDVATTYTVTVTDGSGCTNSGTVEVTPSTNGLPLVSIDGADGDEVCSATDKEITALVDNGSISYSCDWSYSDGAVANGTTDAVAYTVNETLEANATSVQTAYDYTVVVIDANNCTATASRTINVNPLPFFTATADATGCSGAGIINVDIQNGEATYDIDWTGGAGVDDAAATYAITDLTAGDYEITVEDNNGCSYATTSDITIDAFSDLTNVAISSNQFVCYDAPVAPIKEVNQNVTNGNIDSYQWYTCNADGSNPVEIADATSQTYTPTNNTTTGYYLLKVNYNVCQDTEFATSNVLKIQVNPAFTYTATPSDVLCNGGTTGEIVINATGGATGNYNVSWTPANASNVTEGTTTGGTYTITGLDNETYTITVTDSEGCAATGTEN